ncbi:TetR/AcrR family transcriptional regulator [Mycobacterium yunnanensis]|uniref:TetR/AcrR family transcriptional regulator n=1 Tax=Mycobacterium yunnanensis TaxID=368477 RepID=A0A9X2YYP8_9MYCO|nr:TetR/AcrR family transcriptional regulator [Mycobacterium yunnanensis]MCV7420783.1 TetR/AcrR family transcriptional regulator [Mycobacterium yunnanensis]
MVGGVSRESYFETGLDVLADVGYGGLKLAEVCNRLGVTTGSFYHYFPSWSAYTRELIAHWLRRRLDGMTVAHDEPDPRRRIDVIIKHALALPHGAEAAIRVWSSLDPDVLVVQTEVDKRRFDVMYDAAFEILGKTNQAYVFASWSMYLLIGYEQATLPRDTIGLRWAADQLLDALDSGRFASVPDDE